MKYIPLTQGRQAIVDDEDYEVVRKYKWSLKTSSDKKRHYVTTRINNKTAYLHRLIMNPPKHLEIDHRNHNCLDNRKCNLRICTHSQNMQNSMKKTNCKSKYKGIYWEKKKSKWRPTINDGNHNIYLGYYESEIEAAKAYDKKAIELFGEFAFVNFGTGVA